MTPFLYDDRRNFSLYFTEGQSATFKPGEIISEFHDRADFVALVRRGIYRVSLLSRHGTERLLYFGFPGCILGVTACFGQQPYRSCVRVYAETTCEIVYMSQSKLRSLCMKDPEFAWALLVRASNKAACLAVQVENAAFRTTIEQVASLILAMWWEGRRQHRSSDYQKLLYITHDAIAAATGRTRVSVTYALNRLKKQKAIKLHRGYIEVLDPAILSYHADDMDFVEYEHLSPTNFGASQPDLDYLRPQQGAHRVRAGVK